MERHSLQGHNQKPMTLENRQGADEASSLLTQEPWEWLGKETELTGSGRDGGESCHKSKRSKMVFRY